MSSVRRFWAPAVGIAAIIGGIFIARSAPVGFGWFAYAPLTDAAFVPPFMTPQLGIGIAVAGAGLALLAGWVGFRIGRRREPAD